MKVIGQFEFPETQEETHAWEPITRYVALHSKVLAVSKTRIEAKWAAYIGNVPGEDHRVEYHDVLNNGMKLPESIARAIFRDIPAELEYAI